LAQAIDPEKTAIVVSDLRPRRDHLFISDLIGLLTRMVFRREGDVFNAGSGSSVGVGELIALVNELLPRPKLVHTNGQIRPVEVMDVFADISRARDQFDWAPRVTLREGLRETLAWSLNTYPRTPNAEY
jgi:nucleoside-diphosphate-sugar epimerase